MSVAERLKLLVLPHSRLSPVLHFLEQPGIDHQIHCPKQCVVMGTQTIWQMS